MGKQQFGQVLLSKSGDTFYINVERDVTLKAGDKVYLNKPQEEITSLVAHNFITQAEADARIAKVPGFVKFNVNLAKDAKGVITGAMHGAAIDGAGVQG